MLTFLNSAILLALPTVALPLLIHLFNKQKRKRIEFSSTLFLKMLERQRLKRLKLYQYLLILVRTLLILFLVLAFARPTLTPQLNILGDSAQTTAVILLDNGIHMHRYDKSGQRFNRAKRKTKTLLTQFDSDDKIFVMTTTNPDQLIDPNNALDNMECSYKNSNWNSSMTHAMTLLAKNKNFNLELYIISDFQFKDKSFMSNLDKYRGIRTYLMQVNSGEAVNVSIDSINIKNKIFEINRPILFDVFLSNTSREEINDLELHLFINDQRISHRTINFKPLEKKIESLILKPKTYGYSSGYIEINDDDLLADNRYFFSVDIPKEITLLVVDDNPSSYFKAALSSIQENTNLKFTTETFSSWARQSFDDFKVILLVNFSIITEATQDRLKNFLQQGGAIIFIPGEMTNLSEINKLISTLNINTKFDSIVDSESMQDYYTIKRPNINHPLFSGLFRDKSPDFAKPKFFRYFKIFPNFSGEAILSFNTNDPFLLINDSNRGSVIFITSNIQKKWTDLQFRGIFLPLFLRLFYLGASNSMVTHTAYKIGDEIVFTLNQQFGDNEYHLETSDGNHYRIVPDSIASNIIFQLDQLERPGNFKLLAGNTHVTTLSVNANTKNLMPPYINIDTLASNVDKLVVFRESEDFETTIQEARFGHELWYYLVIFAFIMFLLELILVKRIEGKNTK